MSTLQTYNLKHPDASGNQITFTSGGDVNFDNGAVYLDSANNRLGIGTISPAYQLDVQGAGNSRLRVKNTSVTGDAQFHHDGNGDLAIKNSVSGRSINFFNTGFQRMQIDSSGRLLVGTSTATNNLRLDAKLAVVSTGSGNFGGINLTNYGGASDATASFIDFNRSRGTTDGSFTSVASGDILGFLVWRGTTGSGFDVFSQITTEVDGTPGPGDAPGRLVFSTTADGASSPTERMRIESNGRTSIKTDQASNTRNTVLQFQCSNQGRGRILSGNSDSDSPSFGAGSDRRLKTNIRNYTGGLEKIKQIPVKIYDEVNTDATDVLGWVADEVSPVFPDAVIGEPNAVDPEGNPEYQLLASLKFFPDLVQCVQTLITKVETLEQRLSDAGIA